MFDYLLLLFCFSFCLAINHIVSLRKLEFFHIEYSCDSVENCEEKEESNYSHVRNLIDRHEKEVHDSENRKAASHVDLDPLPPLVVED